MGFNYHEKKYIKEHVGKESARDMAKHLKVSLSDVEKYITGRWDTDEENSSPRTTSKGVINYLFSRFEFKDWYVMMLLVLGIVIAYVNGLFNDFLSDDLAAIVNNPHILVFKDVFRFPQVFLRDLFYYIIYHTAGPNPAFFRGLNLFFHISNVLMLYILIRTIFSFELAVFTAALFAIHPMLVESITWISGGPYPQYTFFFLITFLTYLLSKKYKRFYILSLIALIFSLLSSYMALMGPFILGFYELVFKGLRKNWQRLLPYFAIGGGWGLIYVKLLGGRVSSLQNDFYQSGSNENIFIKIPIAITNYIQLIIWPDMLTLYHTELAVNPLGYAIRSALFLLVVAALFISIRKNKVLAFGIGLFLISLVPTLSPLPIAWAVAERYAYLGTAGVLLVFGYLFYLLSRKKNLRIPTYVVFGLIIVALMARTIIRNFDWKNQDNLWLSAARTSPSSHNNHNNLGDVYFRHGEYAQAEAEFKRAIEIQPNYADAYHNLGNTYQQEGKLDLAMASYQKALSINPRIWQSYEAMGEIYFNENQFEQALKFMEQALAVSPDNAQIYNNIGVIYIRLNNKEKAKEAFTKALEIQPNYEQALQGLQEANK